MLDSDVADYLTLASQCQTQNEFNRLHIDLENVLTPLEIANVARLANLPQTSVRWLEKIRDLCPELIHEPKRFERRRLSDRITAYEGSDLEPAERDLLVAFGGNAERLMVPVSVFLQFFDPRNWDLVVIRKRKGSSYQSGLDGVAVDFPDLVRYIEIAAGAKRYRRVMTFGTSGGGCAAVTAAVLMQAGRGISICGSLPKSNLHALPRLPQGGGDFRFVYGEGFARDHQSAIAMCNVFGGRLYPVPEVDGHGVLKVLLSRGDLPMFLGEMLV